MAGWRLEFEQIYFPAQSNARMIDFYGEKSKADYPVSVKSGGGGKVSIGNILDALADKVKEGKVNPAEQKSYKVFQTVQGNGSREGIVKLHTLPIQLKYPLSIPILLILYVYDLHTYFAPRSK